MKLKINQCFLSYIFSFGFPILILIIIFNIFKVYPFGKNTVLITDLFHQYIHYYNYFKEAIKGDESLFYSWNAGLGSNFIGNIAYYIASPVLIILFLFPKEFLPEAVFLIILVKIGLCGLSINYFIRKKFISIKIYEGVLFSAFYALMSYNITYYYNVMWLDGVILLPLLILCIDSILSNKSIIPYIFLLSTLFLTNFYISYMIGLFIFLYFILDFLISKKFTPTKNINNIFYKFIFGTLISIGISCFLTVPTFFQLLGSIHSTQVLSNNLSINFLLKLLCGVYDSIKDGSPNIYIGTFVLILIPAFFISKIHYKEKFKWGALLIILAISFIITPINLLWHAGDVPNWFPYRYSFIFSFIMFYISLAAYEVVHTIKFRFVLLILFINILLITGVYLSDNENKTTIFISLLTMPLFVIVLYIKKRNLKSIGLITFFLFTILELSFNSTLLIANEFMELGIIDRSHYTIFKNYENAINKIKSYDSTGYYRIETDINQTDNDSLSLGYSSFGHSSSMLNTNLISTMRSIGFNTRKVNYNKKGSTIFTDSILGLKYFVSSKELKKYGYKEISRIDKLIIYKNDNYLPIGYPINKEINDIKITQNQNPFKLQNEIYQTITKTKDILFDQISPQKIEFQNAKFVDHKNGKEIIRTNKNENVKIKYFFNNVHHNSNLYIYFNIKNKVNLFSKHDSFKVLINNKELDDYQQLYFNGIIDAGKINNKRLIVELQLNEDDIELINNELFYFINLESLNNYNDSIERNLFKVTKKFENSLDAKIKINNNNQLLYLSIPWDEGWRVSVDGKKVKPLKVLGAFMGIPVEKGEHELHMEFYPKGFLLGSIISTISLLILLLIILWKFKKSKAIPKNNY